MHREREIDLSTCYFVADSHIGRYLLFKCRKHVHNVDDIYTIPANSSGINSSCADLTSGYIFSS